MAIGPDSIIQLKFFQELLGQQVLNVQYYVVVSETGAVTSLSGFAEAAYNLYTTTLDDLQSNQLIYRRVELYEVNGIEFDIYTPDVAETGNVGGEIMSSFNAISIRQVRNSRATRHGYKRLAGVSETIVANGQLTPTAFEAANIAGDILFHEPQTWVSVNEPTRSILVLPIIWGGNDPAYPLGRFSTVDAIVVNPWVSTQNTRKVGRGA